MRWVGDGGDQCFLVGLAACQKWVPWELILSPMLFNIFINDLDDEIESTFTMSADDRKLCDEVVRRASHLTVWFWTDFGKNYMKFKKNKCKVLHLG